MSEVLARLRATIGSIEGGSVHDTQALPFGIASLDSRLVGDGLRIDALHEVCAASSGYGDDAASTLFIAGIAARTTGQVLWIVRRQDLFAPGLFQAGLAPERLIHVEANGDADLLAIMEDALHHRGLGAVVGEVKKVSMAVTRRLQLAAEGGPTLALMQRRPARVEEDAFAQPSAAATRWRIGCLPSSPLPVAGVGRARWRVEMVRQRGGPPFETEMEACDETGRCALAAELVDRPDHARRADARATG